MSELKTTITTMSQNQTTQTNAIVSLLQSITKQLTPSVQQESSTSNQKPPIPTNTSTNSHLKSPKIHLPAFDGTTPLDWLFQADQYFNFYRIPYEQRVSLASFHFNGEALSWYKYLYNNNLLGDWPQFTRALQLRFGPSYFENHQATLFKLQQTTTVVAYQAEFERICNCVTRLSHTALLNCFISGLL
ncbi:uncharacterized protein [Rutidosis leptorrhynchoides]|uniref:uncharacterized protein n=1 Tax=Rutidosis leptorrhynchoides TaxID=125765 RepID=UPI003A99FD2F